jgi:hypothetical protein
MAGQSRLEVLPRELRDEIYDLTMVAEGTTVHHNMTIHVRAASCDILPGLATASKQIFFETGQRYKKWKRHRANIFVPAHETRDIRDLTTRKLTETENCETLDIRLIYEDYHGARVTGDRGYTQYSVDGEDLLNIVTYFPNVKALKVEVQGPPCPIGNLEILMVIVHPLFDGLKGMGNVEEVEVVGAVLGNEGSSMTRRLNLCREGGVWVVKQTSDTDVMLRLFWLDLSIHRRLNLR